MLLTGAKPEIGVRRRPPCGRMGDVDGDGWVTISDAEMVAAWLVGNIELSAEQLARADVSGDRQIGIGDALFIAQFVEGQRDTFPVCSL